MMTISCGRIQANLIVKLLLIEVGSGITDTRLIIIHIWCGSGLHKIFFVKIVYICCSHGFEGLDFRLHNAVCSNELESIHRAQTTLANLLQQANIVGREVLNRVVGLLLLLKLKLLIKIVEMSGVVLITIYERTQN